MARSGVRGARDALSHGHRCAAGGSDQSLVVACRAAWQGTRPGALLYPQRRAPWAIRLRAIDRCSGSRMSNAAGGDRSPGAPGHMARDAWVATVGSQTPQSPPQRGLRLLRVEHPALPGTPELAPWPEAA